MVLTCWQRMDGLLRLPRCCDGLAGSAAVCRRSLTLPRSARVEQPHRARVGLGRGLRRQGARAAGQCPVPGLGSAYGAAHALSRSGRGAVAMGGDHRCPPLLAGLRVPALVIHRPGDRSVPAAEGRYLAGHIPDAEYAELPGEDHTLFVGISGLPSAP